MKKLLGTLIGVGLIGFGGLMLIGTFATAGDSGIGVVAIVAAMMLGIVGVGALIVRWAWNPAPPQMATLLGADGQVVSLPASMLPAGAQVGQMVGVGEMRGIAEPPTGQVKAALAPAEQALLARDYQTAFRLYQEALQAHPSAAPLAYANMGACCFFFREYDRAIELYGLAKQHGANPVAMDENVVEAQEAKAKGAAAT